MAVPPALRCLINPDGSTDDPDGVAALGIGADVHRSIHAAMVVTRRLDDEFVALQRQGQLALFPSCRGQEAAQVGSAFGLRPGDFAFPQYRELGVFVARGVDPAGISSMWRGTWHGGADLLEHACAPLSIPIATQALHAVGYAMGLARDHADDIAVAYLGDGATSEGDAHEAFNLAAVQQAPVVFIVQNNQWAISVPFAQQTGTATIAEKAAAYGMPGALVDGNDVLACIEVVRGAAARARLGGGPTLVEALTYRMGAHTTSDDPGRYRDDAEVAAWRARDPIDRYRRWLVSAGLLDDAAVAAADDRAATAARDLRAAVVDAPDLDPVEIFDHVFAAPGAGLRAQREQFLAARDTTGARP
jgi:2-oxoisovalerate dehydrogenase E1 component alpha subunit